MATTSKGKMKATNDPILLCERCHHEFLPYAAYPSVDFQALRLTRIPSEEDRWRNLAFIEEEEGEIARIDQEVGRLYHLIHRLEATRRVLRRKIDERRSLLSSIRKIPLEIWGQIFTPVCFAQDYTLLVYLNESKPYIYSPTQQLSLVCSQWRDNINMLPHLWSAISIDMHLLYIDIRPLLELYLNNSGEYHLKVRIQYSGTYLSNDEYREPVLTGHATVALQVLMKEMSRFAELELHMNMPESWIYQPDFLHNTTFPYLRSFRNHTEPVPGMREDTSRFWEAIQTAPLLTDAFTLSVVDDFFMLPYWQLTRLALESIKVNHLVQLLGICPNLESILVQELGKSRSTGEQLAPVTVPCLQSLVIGLKERLMPNDLSPLFIALTLPSLVNLEIVNNAKVDSGRVVEWTPSLNEMLRRSPCRLERLALYFPQQYFAYSFLHAINEILQDAKHLKRLMIAIKGCPNRNQPAAAALDLLMKLTVPSGVRNQTIPAPKLTHLALDVCDGVSFARELSHAEILINMVESRSRVELFLGGLEEEVRPLQYVHVSIVNPRLARRNGQVAEWHPFFRPPLRDRVLALEQMGSLCFLECVEKLDT
ncbi:hypothetical protein Moror_12619 [Moniliophthora roreri MCA 2997]|uniref:F-box domain-containing protein n=2 Tax=Moniliophthora roreri TaxID=221103 RepID=V2XPF3_MONRO|nr:hypothetical protein Moror_12619 [Moniliophthora roreri MCA 2997]